MTTQLATIELPDDMQWIDEFTWLPVAQQVDIASDGALHIEESVQLAGRPVTLEGRLEGSVGFALPARSTIVALHALAQTPRTDPMTLLLPDGRSFNVMFRHGDGVAVEAHPIKHIVPAEDADLYTLTLRLMQV